MSVANPREVPEYELNPLELQVRKSDGISKVRYHAYAFFSSPFPFLPFSISSHHTSLFLQGAYQVAKWNGTKVSVKILDKHSYSDPHTM